MVIYVTLQLGVNLFSQNIPSLDTFNWLLGNWESSVGNEIILEQWKSISDSTFEGISFSKTDSSIAGYESLRLVRMVGEIFYIAKVSHNELPVAFKLVDFDKNSLCFENLKHDFPKSICYELISEEKLQVTVGDDEKYFVLEFSKE